MHLLQYRNFLYILELLINFVHTFNCILFLAMITVADPELSDFTIKTCFFLNGFLLRRKYLSIVIRSSFSRSKLFPFSNLTFITIRA